MDEKQPKIKFDDFLKFRPKGLGQRCPVCNGFGTLKYGAKTCQACNGKGYILVPVEEVRDGE